jgi:predicted RNA methylase
MDYARLADFYDTFVRSAFDIAFFIKEAKGVSGEVLELMAGTGRVSVPLVESGVRLTCVDNSPEMLAKLRAKRTDQHQENRSDLLHVGFLSESSLASRP